MKNEQPALVRQRSLRSAIFFGLALIAVDAFVMNQGAIALLVGLWLLFVGLPLTLFAKKYATVRLLRLRNIAIYFVAIILVFVLNAANNQMAKSRAEVLVSTIKSFHEKNLRYPKSLAELVPDYVEQVPVAKYTLMFNQFGYYKTEQGASLYFVSLPPFGRPIFSFPNNKWGYID